MDKKVGLFIKTYSNSTTSEVRINMIEELFISVKNNVDPNIIKILIVDQCDNKKHKEIIYKYSNIFNEIIFNKSNKGISACQNIGIRRLLYKYDIDIGFGCDDDIIIYKNGINRYVDTIIKSNIHHFCYFPYAEFLNNGSIGPDNDIQHHFKDNILFICGGVAGVFFSFTKEMIKNIGYFPQLPYAYGGEHEIFTQNFMKSNVSYDIISSNSKIKNDDLNIELNKNSNIYKSMIIDTSLLNLNVIKANEYKKNLGQYIPYTDGTEYIEIVIFHSDNYEDAINKILSNTYLNYKILFLGVIDYSKYNNKLYIDFINSCTYDLLVNKKNKTYVLNYILNENFILNNNNIHFVNSVDEIYELKNNNAITDYNFLIQ